MGVRIRSTTVKVAAGGSIELTVSAVLDHVNPKVVLATAKVTSKDYKNFLGVKEQHFYEDLSLSEYMIGNSSCVEVFCRGWEEACRTFSRNSKESITDRTTSNLIELGFTPVPELKKKKKQRL